MKNDVEDPAEAQGRLSEPFTFQIIVLVSLLCLKDYFFGIYLQTPWVGTVEQNIYVSGLLMHVSTVSRGFELVHYPRNPIGMSRVFLFLTNSIANIVSF